MRPVVVVTGEPEHGVTIFGAGLARAVEQLDEVAGADLDAVPAGAPVHVQFTDRAWGETPAAAATALERVAARHPLTATLHDVPQPSDGDVSLRRRADAYSRVVRAARGVVVSSAHERRLLAEHTTDAAAAVIPLPVGAPLSGTETVGRDVGVLGFFYPGKGHDEALAAAIGAGAAAITVLGRASPGHERDLDAFVERADAARVPVEVTGYLPHEELVARARRVGVPVAGHRHISASGSIGTWLEAGRRPVVVRSAYTEEYGALRPGAIALTDDLAGGVRHALDDPASTWLPRGTVLPWGPRDAARAYLDWWAAL